MSHPDIAPQPSVPTIESLAQRSRAEIIDRYRKFRAINRTHNNGALKFMSSEALIELARRLGVLRGRKLILGSEEELALVNDLAFYGRQGGRKRPLDRYASSQRLSPDSDEARVLDAMLAARFVLIRAGRRHPEAGLIVTDLLRDEEFWLVDEGLEASMPVGFKIATRVFSPEDFHMTTGALVPLEGAILMSALARRPILSRMNVDEAAQDRRFAEAIYREAIHAGATERVTFQDSPGFAGAAA